MKNCKGICKTYETTDGCGNAGFLHAICSRYREVIDATDIPIPVCRLSAKLR